MLTDRPFGSLIREEKPAARPVGHPRSACEAHHVRLHPDQAGLGAEDPGLVARRGEEAGDHQLPDLQAGAGRSLLRPHLRADQGLRVRLRQVQAHEVRRGGVRQVRGGGHAGPRAPRAHGAHRAGLPGLPRVVLQGPAQPHRAAPRHVPARSGEDPLLRGVRRPRVPHQRDQEAGSRLRGPHAQAARGARAGGAQGRAWGRRPSASSCATSTSTPWPGICGPRCWGRPPSRSARRRSSA